jgi:CelD/BcsL family acetyltransferase involved in cellulose biosynthesis
MLHVTRITQNQELRQFTSQWNELGTGRAFESWEWLVNWWHAFAGPDELYVLAAHDEQGQLQGIAPFYRESSAARGRLLKFLGSGKACTEYQSLLVRPESCQRVAEAFADWLRDAARWRPNQWDALKLDSVAVSDPAMATFVSRCEHWGALLQQEPAPCCWRIDLPPSWSEYMESLAGNVRRKVRKLVQTYVDTARAAVHECSPGQDTDQVLDRLIDFHQRRWQEVNVAGCFSRPEFSQFLRAAAHDLSGRDGIALSLLTIDGQSAAVGLFLRDTDGTHSLYQCGTNPDCKQHQPGWLLNILSLKKLIEQGVRSCDYLRGDERYKRELGATAVPLVSYRIAAPHAAGRLRHSVELVQDRLRDWAKQLVAAAPSRTPEPRPTA